MTWLTEDPTLLITLGLIVELFLGIALFNSGRLIIAGPMLVVGAIVLAGVMVERWIVTDREAVLAALDEAVEACEAEQVDRLLAFIDPAQGALRRTTQAAITGVQVDRIKLVDVEVQISRLTPQPTATIYVTARVSGQFRGAVGATGETFLSYRLDWRKVDDRWLITAAQATEFDLLKQAPH